MEEVYFAIKRKAGTVRDSCFEKTEDENCCYLDVPFTGSVCLVDDIQQVIVRQVEGAFPFTYAVEPFPLGLEIEMKDESDGWNKKKWILVGIGLWVVWVIVTLIWGR